MTGQHPGAPAPIASPSSLPASRRTLQLVPTASTRTRRNHGAFTLGGGQLAFVYSARSAGKLYGVSVELGADTLRLAASMTVGQARAMARALLAAAAAVAGTEARAPTSLPARKLAPRAPPKVTALCDSYAGFAPSERTALETAKAILLGRLAKRGALVESTLAAKELARLQLGGLDVECFAVLFIDQQHRVLAFEEMFRGTVAKTAVYPREIARRALALNATAVILVHNHPSGLAEPSDQDEHVTQVLKSALQLIDVRVVDHLVVGGHDIVSFAERGLI